MHCLLFIVNLLMLLPLILSYTKMVFIYDTIVIAILNAELILLIFVILILIHEMRVLDIFTELLK